MKEHFAEDRDDKAPVLSAYSLAIEEVIQTPERPISETRLSVNQQSDPLTSISSEIILKKSMKRNKCCYLLDMCMHCKHYSFFKWHKPKLNIKANYYSITLKCI